MGVRIAIMLMLCLLATAVNMALARLADKHGVWFEEDEGRWILILLSLLPLMNILFIGIHVILIAMVMLAKKSDRIENFFLGKGKGKCKRKF